MEAHIQVPTRLATVSRYQRESIARHKTCTDFAAIWPARQIGEEEGFVSLEIIGNAICEWVGRVQARTMDRMQGALLLSNTVCYPGGNNVAQVLIT